MKLAAEKLLPKGWILVPDQIAAAIAACETRLAKRWPIFA
jgi:hypothetical protein